MHLCPPSTDSVDTKHRRHDITTLALEPTSPALFLVLLIWMSWYGFPISSPNLGFPGNSAGKESACNAGNPGSIPESRRSLGDGIGYAHQYSWASLMAQMVKNPPTMRETWVQSLSREDSLEEGMVTHSSILAWRIPMDKRAWMATVHGVAKSGTWLNDWAPHSTAPVYLLTHCCHPSNHVLSGLKTHTWPAECGHLCRI